MATSRDFHAYASDLIACPICLELFDKPKSLPCLHTFCLKCIEGHCRDKEPGDELPCPVCRQKFNIPANGVRDLIDNFFIQSLVDAKKMCLGVKVPESCEACVEDSESGADDVRPSTVFCVECDQKLCEQCSRPHRRMKGGPHRVVPIGSESEARVVAQARTGKCDKHKNDDVRLYCFDCNTNVCVICFAEEHQQHKCKSIDTVAVECVKQIDADLGSVEKRLDGTRKVIDHLDERKRQFMDCTERVAKAIVAKGDMLKQQIDRQVNDLLLEVQSLKAETCKEIESQRENAEMKLVAFETFSAYCNELKAKGEPCDITRAADGLHARATELAADTLQPVYTAPIIMFCPADLDEFCPDSKGNNLLGVLKSTRMTHGPVTDAATVTSQAKRGLVPPASPPAPPPPRSFRPPTDLLSPRPLSSLSSVSCLQPPVPHPTRPLRAPQRSSRNAGQRAPPNPRREADDNNNQQQQQRQNQDPIAGSLISFLENLNQILNPEDKK